MSGIDGIDLDGAAEGTGDDPVNCGICGEQLSIATIAEHLIAEHDFGPDLFRAIADAPIVDLTLEEARWRVHTLPRRDDTTLELYLVCPTDDPEVIAAVEEAARRAGIVITREGIA